MKGGWVVDVCATCGRLACWPFCEHRPTTYQGQRYDPWCVGVRVAPIDKRGRELAEKNSQRITKQRP